MELNDAFLLGQLFGFLEKRLEVVKPQPGVNVSEKLGDVMDLLRGISGKLKQFSLCAKSCEEFDDIVEYCESLFDVDADPDQFRNSLDMIEKEFSLWKERIQSELIEIKIVQLFTNTKLNPEKLYEGPQAFIDEKVWRNLSELVKLDLTDACRCITLEAFTPAAMITMRCIESTLRTYYQNLTGDDPDNKTWGNLINELKSYQNADKGLLGYLDHLRGIRNTLEHPDARYSQSEAEDVLQHAFYILKIIYA